MKQTIFVPADVLLPRVTAEGYAKWSVVACDQYTSEAAYWEQVEETVGDAPSTLRITYPELYLNEPDKAARIERITQTMDRYLSEDVLEVLPSTYIYVERTMKNGTVRHGIIGAFDLEAYDYNKGSVSAIRATEGTVLSRIPPRVEIRRNAAIECPHVMVLIDDGENRVMAAAETAKTEENRVYSFDLMQNGGHVAGWRIPSSAAEAIDGALAALGDGEAFAQRYGQGVAPLVYAVGDGNHSLATAKACYEALKQEIGDAALTHPARYALAELVNLHDEALEFEPIYRVVFGVDAEDLLSAFSAAYETEVLSPDAPLSMTADAHDFRYITKDTEDTIRVKHPAAQLPVGTLQTFLDKYLADHPEAEVDYIHGEDSTKALSAGDNAVGFLFCGMGKEDLYRTVIFDGALPRKTFSMGEADEKRYYLECRKIR